MALSFFCEIPRIVQHVGEGTARRKNRGDSAEGTRRGSRWASARKGFWETARDKDNPNSAYPDGSVKKKKPGPREKRRGRGRGREGGREEGRKEGKKEEWVRAARTASKIVTSMRLQYGYVASVAPL